jgi:hypothetical protein
MIARVVHHPIRSDVVIVVGGSMSMQASALVVLAWVAGAGATPTTFAHTPGFPREDHGAYPFECRQYGGWTGRAPTLARVQPDRRGAEAFRIGRGEVVDALTGVVVTVRPGRARATSALHLDGVTVEAGQEVLVLRPVGEGVFKIWVANRALDARLLPAKDASLRLLSQPKIVWWVQVRNRLGQIGWTDQADRFDGTDACG